VDPNRSAKMADQIKAMMFQPPPISCRASNPALSSGCLILEPSEAASYKGSYPPDAAPPLIRHTYGMIGFAATQTN
jgi:hypothetical protein